MKEHLRPAAQHLLRCWEACNRTCASKRGKCVAKVVQATRRRKVSIADARFASRHPPANAPASFSSPSPPHNSASTSGNAVLTASSSAPGPPHCRRTTLTCLSTFLESATKRYSMIFAIQYHNTVQQHIGPRYGTSHSLAALPSPQLLHP